MKHYFIFVFIVVAFVAANMVDGRFVRRVNIPHIKRLNLPFFAENKHFEVCNINPTAFIPESCQIVVRKKMAKKVAEQPINLNLNMVYYSNGKAVCNINGKTLSEGSRFDGVRVVKIEKNRVLVRVNGRLKWLGVGVYANQKD